MPRKNPSAAEILVLLPWQVSATLSVVVYICLKWVLPAVGSKNEIIGVYIKVGAQIAWMVALFLGVIAILSAIMRAKKRALLDAQSDVESLRELSWKEFEWLVGEAYRRQGYAVEESLGGGADGGIDLIIRKGGQTHLVQCKQWKVQAVGAPVIREQFGLLSHHKADQAIVITSGRFTRDAIAFAEGKPIELIDGPKLIELVKAVQNAQPAQPRAEVNESPRFVPIPITGSVTCPSCGGPMISRIAKKGSNAGNSFWGCANYPKCRGVRNP
jgi:restriction system protein